MEEQILRYCNVLEKSSLLFLSDYHLRLILKSPPAHGSIYTKELLRYMNFKFSGWPSRNADLKYIEIL